MKCLICGQETKRLELPEEDMYICTSCGYGRPSIQNPIEYTEAYEIKYLGYNEDAINEIRIDAVETILDDLCLHKVAHILDYGCGSGSFVKSARASGFIAYGYDVNRFTDDLRPPFAYAPDIITAWDSFEHLTDKEQKQFFKLARCSKAIILSFPDFSTPNETEVLSWRHYRPKEHLHYYTLESITRRFAMEGFKLYSFSHNEDSVRTAPWDNNILTVGFIR